MVSHEFISLLCLLAGWVFLSLVSSFLWLSRLGEKIRKSIKSRYKNTWQHSYWEYWSCLSVWQHFYRHSYIQGEHPSLPTSIVVESVLHQPWSKLSNTRTSFWPTHGDQTCTEETITIEFVCWIVVWTNLGFLRGLTRWKWRVTSRRRWRRVWITLVV